MGTQFVANSRADGYTMLVAMPGFFIIPPVDVLFGRPPKFKVEQFTPIARSERGTARAGGAPGEAMEVRGRSGGRGQAPAR